MSSSSTSDPPAEKAEKKFDTNKKPEWLVPGYPPLSAVDPVGKAAIEGQTFHYTKVVRTMTDPPVTAQRLGLVSFMLFSEPKELRNGSKVYGYLKLRGNWADESQAKFEASKIIREVDSRYKIRVAPVGHWLPITDESAFDKDRLDVTMKKDEVSLHSEAVKQKQADQRRIQRELRERAEEAESGDIYDDPESPKYYSMRRVTLIRLMEERENQKRRLEEIQASLKKVGRELKTLDRKHTDYAGRWIDIYNVERRKAGIPDYVPSEAQDDEYDAMVFEGLPEPSESSKVGSDDEDEKSDKPKADDNDEDEA